MGNPLMEGILKKLRKKPKKLEKLEPEEPKKKPEKEKDIEELLKMNEEEEKKESGKAKEDEPEGESEEEETPVAPLGQAQKKFSKDIEKLSTTLGTMHDETGKMNERMKRVEENLSDLGAIYELVTNKINPFTEGESVLEQKRQETQAKGKKRGKASLDEAMEMMRGEKPVVQQMSVMRREKEQEDDREDEERKEGEEPARRQVRGQRKALLNSINAEDKRMIEDVIEWLDFLISKVGFKNIPKLLEYYRDIGWVSNEVKFLLEDYVTGLKNDKFIDDKGKDRKTFTLSADDHKMSLEMLYKIVEDQKLMRGA